MRNSRMFIKRVAIALSALLLVSAVGLAQVTVGLPTVTGKAGAAQTIPITVGDLTGKGAISFQFTVTFDSKVVTVSGVTTAGTLSAGLNAPVVNAGTAGKITVVAAGTSAMSGSGTLIYLNATGAGKGTSALTFSSFQFNEGTPAATTTNGQFTVPDISVTIGTITTTVPVGGTFTLPVTTEDVAGKGVLSYQLTATFDATKIKLTGVSTTGTMSSGMSAPVVNTATAGQIKVAAAGTTALTGAGTLFNFTGQVVATGTSAVKFTAFQFNEGTPPAGGVDGSVVVGVAPNQKPVFNFRTPAGPTVISRNVSTTFAVSAKDPEAAVLTFTWKVNGVVVKGPGTDSSYSTTFTDAHGTAKKVVAVFADPLGLADSTTWDFTITPVETDMIPTDFALGQNYPNPFNPSTRISFSMPKEAPVTFEVYNMLGVKIRTLMAGETKSAGTYSISWDGKNDAGLGMPSGVYLYRVQAGTFLASKKMTLLK